VKIINESRHETAWLRPLLKHGAHLVRDTDVVVVVYDERHTHHRQLGTAAPLHASTYAEQHRIDTAGRRYMVTLRLEEYTCKVWHGAERFKRFRAKYPLGIPIESQEDFVVMLTAHEFGHIRQFRRWPADRSAGRRRRRGELDAEYWAVGRLNRYRRLTGRPEIVAVKQQCALVDRLSLQAATLCEGRAGGTRR